MMPQLSASFRQNQFIIFFNIFYKLLQTFIIQFAERLNEQISGLQRPTVHPATPLSRLFISKFVI